MSFEHLFTPHEIRGHEIRNRIFSTAHQTILAVNGAPSDDMAAYHEARARGGAAADAVDAIRSPAAIAGTELVFMRGL